MRNCGAGLVTGQLLAVPFAILYSTVPFFVEFHEFYDLTHRSIAYKNTWYPFRFSWNYHELSKNCISAFRLLDATSRFACYCLRILVCLKICCSTWLGYPSVLPGHQRRFSTRPLSWPWFSSDLGHAMIGEKIHVNPVNGPQNSCQKCGDCL